MTATVRMAGPDDLAGFLGLAGEVEDWFGPMVAVAGFHAALRQSFAAGHALCVDADDGKALLGGLMFGGQAPVYHLEWLVVSQASRGRGVGKALVAEAFKRFVAEPATIEVVTFGTDHPAATDGGARVFYERLGFTPGEAVRDGPEGGSRQMFRLHLP